MRVQKAARGEHDRAVEELREKYAKEVKRLEEGRSRDIGIKRLALTWVRDRAGDRLRPKK